MIILTQTVTFSNSNQVVLLLKHNLNVLTLFHSIKTARQEYFETSHDENLALPVFPYVYAMT